MGNRHCGSFAPAGALGPRPVFFGPLSARLKSCPDTTADCRAVVGSVNRLSGKYVKRGLPARCSHRLLSPAIGTKPWAELQVLTLHGHRSPSARKRLHSSPLFAAGVPPIVLGFADPSRASLRSGSPRPRAAPYPPRYRPCRSARETGSCAQSAVGLLLRSHAGLPDIAARCGLDAQGYTLSPWFPSQVIVLMIDQDSVFTFKGE